LKIPLLILRLLALASGRLFAKGQSNSGVAFYGMGLRLISIKGSAQNEGAPLPALLIDHLKLLPATPQTNEYLVIKCPD
jgi:hypothetical protein